jgi:CxxC-x17-CxxC domain-containing protein
MVFVRDFNRDRRSGGGRDFKSRDFDRPQTMFKTICSDCGKECEVPFKPNGSKPVFCRECFQSKRTSEGSRAENFPRTPSFGGPLQSMPEPHKEQFDALNAKLDKILNLLIVKEEVQKVVVSEPITEVKAKVVAVKDAIVKKKKVSKK